MVYQDSSSPITKSSVLPFPVDVQITDSKQAVVIRACGCVYFFVFAIAYFLINPVCSRKCSGIVVRCAGVLFAVVFENLNGVSVKVEHKVRAISI